MRSWNRRGVTDDDDAPGHHVVGRQVTDRLGEGLFSRLDDLTKRNRKQSLCFTMKMLKPSVSQQAFRDRIVARMTVGIGHDLGKQALVRHTVPDPVVKPVPGADIIMLAWNKIAENVRALGAGESEVPMKRCLRR